MKDRRENFLLAEFHPGNCFVMLDFTLVFHLYCMLYLKVIAYPKKAAAVLNTNDSVCLKRR